VQSNRAAIGARIRVVVQSASGEHSYYKTVGTAAVSAHPASQKWGLARRNPLRALKFSGRAPERLSSNRPANGSLL